MATRSIVHPLSTSNHTNVLHLPAPAVQQITQFELGAVLSLRNRARQLEEQIAEAERSIRDRLESGSAVEDGIFRAYMKTTERRSVAWKAVVERELGEDYATRVLAATKPDKFSTLIVSA